MRVTNSRRQRPPRRPDAFTRYLSDIGSYRLLTRADETELAARMRAGDTTARERLVCANLRFVVSVAKRYQSSGVPLADLVSEGNLGLLRAAERFDAAKGVHFISYAVWWIRQAIVQALAKQAHAVRVPVSRAGTLFRLKQRADISIDAPLSSDGGGKLLDHLADESAPEPDADAIGLMLTTSLREALAHLRPREALVLRLHYGIDGAEPLTLDAIGQRLGVTRERARQIKDHALSILRRSEQAQALRTFCEQ